MQKLLVTLIEVPRWHNEILLECDYYIEGTQAYIIVFNRFNGSSQ